MAQKEDTRKRALPRKRIVTAEGSNFPWSTLTPTPLPCSKKSETCCGQLPGSPHGEGCQEGISPWHFAYGNHQNIWTNISFTSANQPSSGQGWIELARAPASSSSHSKVPNWLALSS